ncbi:hypothetical protein [Bailinhaonella thermotolerans]|uniref:Helix-turn-helix domain-containing protein n=1 Tax=Bailinhaonella thermotolerans TaxID=1070861 RepID=A0A3A4A371_9ACTN|nr:hypothetical protein [Bailinhaonella thermotolerans]RJL22042.1 hypothetical protein D5H75_36175 [Bailinhaonella thermotolerans]
MTGGLRKRRTPFVQVPSATIRDKRLSFRARGILAYLLDMPDEWEVRSEVIAAAGIEGREAVRSALHELGEHGYYRLERRHLLDGTFVMGTAISEEPVPEWAEAYAEFGGMAITVVQQRDRSFKVKRKDGRLVDDGFGTPTPPTVPLVEVAVGHTGDGFPGPGFPDSGRPGPGLPDSGAPDSGSPGPINKTDTQDRETERDVPPSSAHPARGNALQDLLGEVVPLPRRQPKTTRRRTARERTPEEQARFERAQEIADAWWNRCDELHIPNIPRGNSGARGFVGFRAMVERALAAGCSASEIKWALDDLKVPFPSTAAFEKALARRRGIVSGGGGGQPSSLHHERDAAAELAKVFG